MTIKQAAAALAALTAKGIDAWAGKAELRPGVAKAHVVTIGRAGELHRDDFAYLVTYAQDHELDLSFGTIPRAVLVLS